MLLPAPEWPCAVRVLLYSVASGHRVQKSGAALLGAAPRRLHFDLRVSLSALYRNWRLLMKTVNVELKRYYPHLTENISLEVSEKIAVTLSKCNHC